MRDRLDSSFFPFVIKPSRYCGGEPGQIAKSHEGSATCLLTVTDRYERGSIHPLTQTHYHYLNAQDGIVCERVFVPDKDAEEVLRAKGIPLFSAESYCSANTFDCIALLCTDVVQFSLIPVMLERAGIAVQAAERIDSDPIVILCGPVCVNPMPVMDFVDGALIGDSEAPLAHIMRAIPTVRNNARNERLASIAKDIPSLRLSNDSDSKITITHVYHSLDASLFPVQPLTPCIDTTPNRLIVELGRSSLPAKEGEFRALSTAQLSSLVHRQLECSGYSEVEFAPANVSRHSDASNALLSIAASAEANSAELILPYIHPNQIAPAFLDVILKTSKSHLRIDMGASSDTLRAFLSLDFGAAQILSAANIAFSKGVTRLKLRCIIGVPGEEESDIRSLATLLNEIVKASAEIPGRRTIGLVLYRFQPVPHTRYQWDGIISESVFLERMTHLRKLCRHEGFSISQSDIESRVITAMLTRGGRDLSALLMKAASAGFRGIDLEDEYELVRWQDWAQESGVNLDALSGAIPFTSRLPWSSISFGVPDEQLAEQRRTLSKTLVAAKPVDATLVTQQTAGTAAVGEFGRSKKKVVSRVVSAPTKNQIRIRWGRTERMRYLSHLDCIRVMERAIRKSRLPVAWSGVEHPTMKISFGPPLPLGFTSECELLDITLSVNVTSQLLESFRAALPPGMLLLESRVIFGKLQSLSASLNRAMYSLPVTKCPLPHHEMETVMAHIMSLQTCNIIRETKSGAQTVDIRTGIYGLAIRNGKLEMILGIGESGYVRPVDLLGCLFPDQRNILPSLLCHREDLYRVDTQGVRVPGVEV